MTEPPNRRPNDGGDRGEPRNTFWDRFQPAEGPWDRRVLFSAGKQGELFAYRPGEIVVANENLDGAVSWLKVHQPERQPQVVAVSTAFTLVGGVNDPIGASAALRLGGFVARVNHVFFADADVFPNPGGFPNPGDRWTIATGCCEGVRCVHGTSPKRRAQRRTLARPAGEPPNNSYPPPLRSVVCEDSECVVVIIDTGVAGPGTSTLHTVTDTASAKNAGAAKVAATAKHGPARKQPVVLYRPSGDIDTEDRDDDGFLDPFSGHGSFIAGVINRVAPNARIVCHRAMPSAGDVDDFHVALAIDQVMARLGRLDVKYLHEKCGVANCKCSCAFCKGKSATLVNFFVCSSGHPKTTADLAEWSDAPVIVNLSFSGYAEDNDPPVCTAAASKRAMRGDPAKPGASYRYSEGRDVVIVASAGNNSDCRIVWPGGFDEVIAVAALDGSFPAWYTNYGKWVNACAQGSNVISNFYHADGVAFRERNQFNGWASWSGTSFAAPLVAAALAQEVLSTGDSPRDAVDRIIEQPELYRLQGLGVVVNSY